MEDLLIHKVRYQLGHLINIQNSLISAKDNKKEELDLDEAVNNFFVIL